MSPSEQTLKSEVTQLREQVAELTQRLRWFEKQLFGKRLNMDIHQYSLAKMIEEGNKKNIFAAGKFQLIPDTLSAAIDKLKLDTSLPFDEEMQDFIFDEYLIKIKRPHIIAFLEGDGDVEDAIYAWALEFASGGVRKGKKLSKRKKMVDGEVELDANGKEVWHQPLAEVEGISYYSGDGINKAHLSPDTMKKALVEAKKSY